MCYSQRYNLYRGDKIVKGIYATGLIKHFAVFLGNINGIEWVAENHKGHGVQVVTAEQYFSVMPTAFYIEQFAGTEQERTEIVRRALSLQGAQYNLFAFNCEHYANYVQYGVAESYQLTRGIIFGAMLAVMLWKR